MRGQERARRESSGGVRLALAYDAPHLTLRPSAFLDDDAFSTYRQIATTQGTYDTSREAICTLPARGPALLSALRDAGFVVDVEDEAHAAMGIAAHAANEAALHAATAAMDARLYPFQKEAVAWLAPRDRGILALEMGLGKTVISLLSAPAEGPVLLVLPFFAMGVWEREIAAWRPSFFTRKGHRIVPMRGDLGLTLPDRSMHVLSRGKFVMPEGSELAAISCDSLPEDFACPEGLTVIADEAHCFKSARTLRNRHFRTLARRTLDAYGRVWLLTGTPLLNHPLELYNLLKITSQEKDVFPRGWPQFYEEFHGSTDRWGKLRWGTPNPDIKERLARVMLRRKREDVLPDLPTKTEMLVPCSIDPATTEWCGEVLSELTRRGLDLDDLYEVLSRPAERKRISEIREKLALAKIPAMLAWIRSFEDQSEPLVVFSAHVAPIEACRRPGWAIVTGETSADERRQAVSQFQAGELLGIAGTIGAMGTAVTLHRAAHVLFVDEAWTPALNDQAADRLVRIGQKRHVTVRKLVADHALDRLLARCIARKKKLIAALE